MEEDNYADQECDTEPEDGLPKYMYLENLRIDRHLAEGSYGAVFVVEWHSLPCAAKGTHAVLAHNDNAGDRRSREETYAMKQFKRESRQWAVELRHPNIVQFLGLWEKDGVPYIVMEMLHTDLSKFLEDTSAYRDTLRFEFINSIAIDVCRAFAYLEDMGVMHRDLKGNNVLLTSHLVAKVSDFGVARRHDGDEKKSRTRHPGNQYYAAPEVSEGDYGLKVDVFSFGCLLVELITHQTPEPEGDRELLTEYERRVPLFKDIITTARTLFEPLIKQCLRHDPRERPKFADLLKEFPSDQTIVDGERYSYIYRHLKVTGECDNENSTLHSKWAGKSNSQQPGLLARAYQYITSSDSSKVYDNTSKNDTVTSQQPSSTASKPKDSIRGVTKPIPGAVHDQPLSSTPQRPTKVLYLDSSKLVTEYRNSLGHGSFGRVYAGTYDGNNCAVKVFETNTKLHKIEKEAEVSFLLTHNNVVQVYGLCRKDGKDYLVMERCTTNLTAYLERQRGHQLQYTVKLKLSILHQITQGMLYLHLNEIVHGDLSPGNVLLQLEEPAESPSTLIVKIADFGQSRLLNTNKNKQLTSTHGNDHFMPPEVLNASKEKYPISKSVDLFSFGCLVPYIATCMYPDPTVQAVHGSSELQKRIRHITNRIPVLEPPEFKAACEDLMIKCLQSKPGDRPSFQHISAVLGPHVKIYVDQGYSATEEEKITEIVKLNEELQSKKDWCVQLQEEKDKIKRDYDVSQRDYQDLETKCRDETEKIAELQEEIKSLQMQVIFKEASWPAYSDIGSVIRDTQRLQKERDDAVQRMEYAEERNAELKVQCQGLQEQVDGLKCELNQTTSMKTNLEQKKTELAGEKNSLQGRLQIVEKAVEASSFQCARLEKKVSQLKSEVLTTTTSRNEFQTSCQTLERKKKELEDSLKAASNKLAASKRKVEEHEVTISGQLAKLKDKVQELHSETSAKNLAKGSVARLDTQCKKQEAELVHLKKEVAQLEAKKSELVNNLSAEMEAKEALQENVKKLEEENIKAEKEIGRMTNIVDYVKKESKTKDEEYEKLDRQYKEVAKDGKESTIQLTVKLKDAETSHEKAMAMHHTATKEKEELSRKVEELERKKVELTKTVASNEVEIKEKQEEIESLKASHEKAMAMHHTATKEKEELSRKVKELEKKEADLTDSVASKEKVQAFEDLRKLFDELKHDRSTLELKLQKTQSDYENEQKNCDRERDTTKSLRTEVAQLKDGMSSLEREVQALKDKGNHRREVMQQMVKSMQDKVDAVRSDLDQERSRQSDLKDSRSAELLLTRFYIVRLLKTELVSRATELQKCKDKVQKCKDKLQKCRNELKTTTAVRDKLSETVAMQKYMDQHFHKLQEQMRRNLVQIVTKVIAGVHEVSAGVSELDKEVQQLQDQTSSTSPVQQSLTGPAPVSKNLTEDGTRPQEMLCMSQPQTGVPNALVKYEPGGAEGASVQCSSPGSAMEFWQRRDSHARTTGQPSRAPLLQDPVEFMKSFMDGCKKEFLQHVTAKPIAAKLESDKLIPSNVKKDIDDAADIESGTLLLFKHFRTQSIPGSIPLFCQIMEESSGNSLMNTFAKAMREKFAHRLFLNQSN